MLAVVAGVTTAQGNPHVRRARLCLSSGTNSLCDLGLEQTDFWGLGLFLAMGMASFVIKWLISKVLSDSEALLLHTLIFPWKEDAKK